MKHGLTKLDHSSKWCISQKQHFTVISRKSREDAVRIAARTEVGLTGQAAVQTASCGHVGRGDRACESMRKQSHTQSMSHGQTIVQGVSERCNGYGLKTRTCTATNTPNTLAANQMLQLCKHENVCVTRVAQSTTSFREHHSVVSSRLVRT